MSAATVRINLLPHREQKRAARQRQFISLAVSLAILALAVVGLGHMYFASRIDNQNSRNSLLKTEIAKLDEQIKEIDKLREQTQALLARKQVVETLQTNRTEAVHLLDQLVRQLPDGIYLRSVRQQGARVTLVGYAQSNARVSTLMRAIESSPWLSQPELVEIKSVPLPGAQPQLREGGPRISEFTLNLQVKRAAAPDEKPAAAGSAKPASPAPAAAAPQVAPAKPAPSAPAVLPPAANKGGKA
jgi:type IV pilus assembly protein PilN